MRRFILGAAIATISFWSGFVTAALLNAGKEKYDERQDDSSSKSSQGPADKAE